MKIPFLAVQFYVAIALAVAALVFKAQHWPGVFALVIAAVIAHVIYLGSMVTEVITSRNAAISRKAFWLISLLAGIAGVFFIDSSIFAFLVITSELTYLKKERKEFILI